MTYNVFSGTLNPTHSLAYGPADATATPPVKSRMIYLSYAGLPRLSWKKAVKWMS